MTLPGAYPGMVCASPYSQPEATAGLFPGAMPIYDVQAWQGQGGLAWLPPGLALLNNSAILQSHCASTDCAGTRRRRRQHRARRGVGVGGGGVVAKAAAGDAHQNHCAASSASPSPQYLPCISTGPLQTLQTSVQVPRISMTNGGREDPRSLMESTELSNKVMEQFDNGDRSMHSSLLHWLSPASLELALSVCGCRVVQKALEVVAGTERALLVERFRGHVASLVESPHGNHVLQKCIEVMPPHTVHFIVAELAAYPGSWLALSQHCFGCRVVERLLEHCPEEQTAPLIAVVVANTNLLCRHSYGNYVVQHVLEYCSPHHRAQIMAALSRADISALAQDRMASHVIERMLELSSPKDREGLLHTILASPPALLEMACSRFGSFLVQRLLKLPLGAQGKELRLRLYAGAEQLKATKHGRKTAACLQEFGDQDQFAA